MLSMRSVLFYFFFFFNDTATTEIYTLPLHDALPISGALLAPEPAGGMPLSWTDFVVEDRKSTRLNSSHLVISYAVFCLKKKKKQIIITLYALHNKQYYCNFLLSTHVITLSVSAHVQH